MAFPLTILETNGEDPIETESRNNIPRELVRVPITQSETVGEGIREFVVMNTTTDSTVLGFVIFSLQEARDNDGNTLISDWSHYDTDLGRWSDWLTRLEVGDFAPGDLARLRCRMTTQAGVVPTSHAGMGRMTYQEVVSL